MKLTLISTSIFSALFTSHALAGAPIPLPIAGAGGPIGLAVAIVGYGTYRFYKNRQDK